MAREFQNPAGSQNEASAKSYRFDTAKHAANRRASSEVPVLFRLQNLQKSQDFSGVTSTTVSEKKSTELSIETKQKTKTASTTEVKAPVFQSNDSAPGPAANSAVPAPNTDRRSNSIRPWSTSVILLGIGFAVVGLLFRNSGSNSAPVANNPASANTPTNTPLNTLATAVATNPPQATAITSADSETTKPSDLLVKTEEAKPEPTFSLEPLAAPKLPDPMVLSLGKDASEAINPSFDIENSNVDNLEFANSMKGLAESSEGVKNTSVDESLSLGTPSQTSIDFNQASPAPRSSVRSVAIPNSMTSDEPSVEPEFTQTNFANESMSVSNHEKGSSGSTVITNPHLLESRESTAPTSVASSQVISTSTPELETEELFKLRAQHSLATSASQQAMAMGRQPMTAAPQQQQATAQWNPASGTFGPNANMVSGQTKLRPIYIVPAAQSHSYNYQPVQPAPQGYGAPQLNGALQAYTAPTNIPTPVSPPQSAPAENAATATAPASVRQPYVPISGSFNPERFGLPENTQTPNQPAFPTSGQNTTPVPVSGGYQPLSPQFQYQPTNGN